jgi:hypothetical protein
MLLARRPINIKGLAPLSAGVRAHFRSLGAALGHVSQIFRSPRHLGSALIIAHMA